MRAHFIELHEQTILPSTIRDEVMDAMQFGLGLLRVYEPVVPVLQDLIVSTRSRCIVDLCSGAGGPWFSLASKLQRDGHNIEVLLTDKFPNEDTAKRVREPRS